MIKLSLKLDVSFSKVAMVFVGLVACYNIYRCVSSLVSSSTDDENMNAVSDVDDQVLENMSESFDEVKPMINIENNEIEAAEIYKPETQVAKKSQAIIADNVLEGNVKPTNKTQITNTKSIRPADDCFKNFERKCSTPKSKQKSPNIEPDNFIETTMIDIEENEIGAPEVCKPETEAARKNSAVNVDNALEDTVKPTKEISINNTKSLRPANDCLETVDQSFSGSESKQKNSTKEPDALIEDSSFSQPTVNNIDLSECFLVNDLYARLTDFKKVSENFYNSVDDLFLNVGIIEKEKEKTKL